MGRPLHNRTATLLVALFCGSLLLRLALLSKGPYHLDCLTFALRAQQSVETGQLHYLHSHGFPLAAWLGAFSVKVFRIFNVHDPVLAVNALSAVFSAMSVPVLYWALSRIVTPIAALIATVLFSFCPIILSLSVFGNSHSLSLFFLVSSLALLVDYRESRRTAVLWISSALFGLGAGTRIQDAVTLLPVISFYFLFFVQPAPSPPHPDAKRHWLSPLIFFFANATVIVLLLYWPLLQQGRPQVSIAVNSDLASRFSGLTLNYLFLNLTYLLTNFSCLGAVTVLAGAVLLYKQDRKLFLFLLTWFLFPLLAFSLLDITRPRFLSLAIIPLYVFLGYLFARFLSFRPVLRANAVLVLFLTGFLGLCHIVPILWFRHRHALIPEYYAWVDQHARPGDYLIISDDGNFLRRYSRLRQLARPLKVRHPYPETELHDFKDNLDHLLRAGASVYITDDGLWTHDPGQQFSEFMFSHYRIQWLGQKPYEDWHLGAIYQSIIPMNIYRLRLKANHDEPVQE